MSQTMNIVSYVGQGNMKKKYERINKSEYRLWSIVCEYFTIFTTFSATNNSKIIRLKPVG